MQTIISTILSFLGHERIFEIIINNIILDSEDKTCQKTN